MRAFAYLPRWECWLNLNPVTETPQDALMCLVEAPRARVGHHITTATREADPLVWELSVVKIIS